MRVPLCEEAIRLARLLLRLFPSEPEIMGLTALLLLQHARAPARLDADGAIVLLEDQDRSLWNREMIAEGLALVDKALRHRRPGPYQVQAAIAALHARAARAEDTDWAEIDLLYGALETLAAVAGRHAQPRGRGRQGARPGGGAGDDRAAGADSSPATSTSSACKGALLMQLGRADEARVAFDRAIALANTAAEAAHIRMHLDRLIKDNVLNESGFQTRELNMTDQAQGVIPHLVVRDAAAALEFYKNGLGATESMRMPTEDGKRIMHSEIQLNGARVFVRDHFPEHCTAQGGHRQVPPEELGGTPVTLHLEVPNCDDAVSRAARPAPK